MIHYVCFGYGKMPMEDASDKNEHASLNFEASTPKHQCQHHAYNINTYLQTYKQTDEQIIQPSHSLVYNKWFRYRDLEV